jgi:hypothetical protein
MKDMYKIICILHEGSRIQSEFIPKHARFRSAGSAAFFRSSFCVRACVCGVFRCGSAASHTNSLLPLSRFTLFSPARRTRSKQGKGKARHYCLTVSSFCSGFILNWRRIVETLNRRIYIFYWFQKFCLACFFWWEKLRRNLW